MNVWLISTASLQLRLTAHDTRYPNNRANATVTIQVTRNLNSPVFSPPSYSRTILDTVPLGYQVVQVNATDGDNVSIESSCLLPIYWSAECSDLKKYCRCSCLNEMSLCHSYIHWRFIKTMSWIEKYILENIQAWKDIWDVTLSFLLYTGSNPIQHHRRHQSPDLLLHQPRNRLDHCKATPDHWKLASGSGKDIWS